MKRSGSEGCIANKKLRNTKAERQQRAALLAASAADVAGEADDEGEENGGETREGEEDVSCHAKEGGARGDERQGRA